MSKKVPADPEHMNDERAGWAEVAMWAFAEETNLTEADGYETMISDLLADLAHLADREGLNMCVMLKRAASHYQEETFNRNRRSEGKQFAGIENALDTVKYYATTGVLKGTK